MNDKELLENILKLEKSSNPEDLFQAMEVINSLANEKVLADFLLLFKDKLYKIDPIRFIANHVNFYVLQEKFLLALDTLSHYQEMPFINLTIDDFMKELELQIKSLINRNKEERYDLSQVQKDLYSKNEDRIIKAIGFLSKSNARQYQSIFKEAFISDIDYKYKQLLMFIVVEQKIDEQFIIKNEGKEMAFNPSQYLLPFENKSYLSIIEYFNRLNVSPSVIKIATELLNITEIKLFPSSIMKICYDSSVAGEIFIYLAKEYLLEKTNYNELILNTGLKKDELDFIIETIKKYNN